MMFIRECKAIARSMIYFSFLAVVVLFYVTQLGDYAGKDIRQYTTQAAEPGMSLSDNPLIAPIPGQDDYGYRNAEIPEQVMPNAIAHLVVEYTGNEFVNYSMGFGRRIKLNDTKLSEIQMLLTQMTGLTIEELQIRRNETAIAESDTVITHGMNIDYREAIPVIIGYNEFKLTMERIDKMIGGGSYYAVSNLKQYGSVAVTYEEKLAEYSDVLSKDKITGAYARLFCDYMGIVLALFSVFVPVSFLLRDKRAKMSELIYSREKSTAKIVLTRYLALGCMTALPFLLLSMIPAVQLILFAMQNSLAVDYWAFVKYIAAWLLPTILATTAAAYLFTMLTDTPIAIVLQLVWSLIGIFTSARFLDGGRYGFEIAIRHNSLFNLQLMQDNISALIVNRLSYTVISLVLIVATVFLYNLKRSGRLNVFKGSWKAIRNR